tara:strand:+ start:402 stop:1133 length:732 start_codon:yes stop_codon:yes gene_type:complete
MAAASEGPGGASATTEGEAEEATAETSEFIREMLENAYGVTSEGVIVQGCTAFDVPSAGGDLDLDYSAAAVDLMGTYIQSGELGFIREYWQDETTGYTVYVYYSYCDNPPTISGYTADEDDAAETASSYFSSQYYDFRWSSVEQINLTNKFRGSSLGADSVIESGFNSLLEQLQSTDQAVKTKDNIIRGKVFENSPSSNLLTDLAIGVSNYATPLPMNSYSTNASDIGISTSADVDDAATAEY